MSCTCIWHLAFQIYECIQTVFSGMGETVRWQRNTCKPCFIITFLLENNGYTCIQTCETITEALKLKKTWETDKWTVIDNKLKYTYKFEYNTYVVYTAFIKCVCNMSTKGPTQGEPCPSTNGLCIVYSNDLMYFTKFCIIVNCLVIMLNDENVVVNSGKCV